MTPALGIGVASASTFTASQLSQDAALLNQFNLVDLGNLTTSANTSGRVLVGGNATFNGSSPTVCAVNCTGNTTASVDSTGQRYGALTVFGNVVAPGGTTAATYVNAGDVDIKGTSTGNFALNNGTYNIVGSASGTNVVNAGAIKTTQSSFAGASYNYNGSTFTNGVTPQVSQTMASVFPFSSSQIATAASQLAQGIANLPGTPGVHAQALPANNNAFLTANADYTSNGYSYGVITTTLANLATSSGGINNGSNAATFVIVHGDGANITLPNLNSYSGANVIYDFVDATTLKFGGGFNGSILAPLANISVQGGTLDGSIIVASITQSQSLISDSNGAFSGNLLGLTGLSNSVPEPASLLLLGIGAAGAAVVRRRRK